MLWVLPADTEVEVGVEVKVGVVSTVLVAEEEVLCALIPAARVAMPVSIADSNIFRDLVV